MQAVMNLCDEAWVLSNGRLIAHGTPREMAGHPAVIEAYLGHGAAARLRAAHA
jgi:branched-chain amino acid transport system ATP-binding protein